MGIEEGRFSKPRYRMDLQLDRAAFQQWLQSADGRSDEGRNHALRMMGTALREELTEKQLHYITLYYVDGKNMVEIGEMFGVDKSTVSRTIKRALRRIKKVLKYSSPILLRSALGESVDN